MNFNNYS